MLIPYKVFLAGSCAWFHSQAFFFSRAFSINQTFTAAFEWKEQEITFCLLSRSSGRRELSEGRTDPLTRAPCLFAAWLCSPSSAVTTSSRALQSQPGCWCPRGAVPHARDTSTTSRLGWALPCLCTMDRNTHIHTWPGALPGACLESPGVTSSSPLAEQAQLPLHPNTSHAPDLAMYLQFFLRFFIVI